MSFSGVVTATSAPSWGCGGLAVVSEFGGSASVMQCSMSNCLFFQFSATARGICVMFSGAALLKK